ncbi:UBX domain-containing protein 2B isoform X1 [Panthera leo]|uniref:UBX domain-containing protein 2B isoform X1 n=1 Tax=Panthera leo TaxID=9689 RepID=UPI001C6A2F8A|nr:UBX domain-containing protein 2B isoform X1 [Panthera leo]
MAEGGGADPGEQERSSGPRPPSARDLQLALAELYEDEVKCKSSKSDRPNAAVFKSPRTPPQRFYSSEREYSGLHIVQPSTGKIVSELFKEAREHGAVPLNEATRASGDNKSKSFTGGGYRLGNSFCKRSEYIYGENQLQDVQILLKLWSNGFSLDDGELRPYHDPPNAQFLESVKKGEIPLELQRLVHGGHVNLDMEDRRDQEYIKPRLRFKAFSGEGQKLGSLTPEIVSTPSSPEEEDKSILNAVVLIDDSVPTTKIQIRLADGSRLIQRFNSTHRYLFQRRPVSRCLGKHYAYSLPRDVNAPIGDLGSTCLGCSGRFQGGELTRGRGLPPGRAGRSSTERSVISPPRRSSFSVSRGGVTSFLSLLRATEAMLLSTDC